MGYLLPANLLHYVGPVGVWGDVNDILIDGMEEMKVMAIKSSRLLHQFLTYPTPHSEL